MEKAEIKHISGGDKFRNWLKKAEKETEKSAGKGTVVSHDNSASGSW